MKDDIIDTAEELFALGKNYATVLLECEESFPQETLSNVRSLVMNVYLSGDCP